jgi:hypothetical protein
VPGLIRNAGEIVPLKLWEVDMVGTALLREWVHARITKLLMCIFSLAVAAVLPACTSLESMTATASAETVTMTNTPTDQPDKKEARKEGAAYNGNWGYAPGNGLDPNDEWGRSSGVLDTASPGCPFKFC